ncbi:MAG: ABC transporter ATP-binding protein [Synergistaceae bacterium]|jgi:ABC-type branched-subunit amino acid transport system ATPase component|nr:ABC transporter ATP-binding protein [Synergistaceae bacterium]
MPALLEVRNLSRTFGGIRAVDDLSFDAARDGITGLIGPNGAGKTTVFNLITGVCNPSGGSVRLNGAELTGRRPDEIVRIGVARTFQNIRLFGRMTCLQNVMVPLLARGTCGPIQSLFRTPAVSAGEREAKKAALEIMAETGTLDVADRIAATLPYGRQRRLEIARALACFGAEELFSAGSPDRLLLLDEPAAGMNEAETRELARAIGDLKGRFGLTVLLIEHHIDMVMELCSHIVVLDRGMLLAEGTPRTVRSDERVVAAYLGRTREARPRSRRAEIREETRTEKEKLS